MRSTVLTAAELNFRCDVMTEHLKFSSGHRVKYTAVCLGPLLVLLQLE